MSKWLVGATDRASIGKVWESHGPNVWHRHRRYDQPSPVRITENVVHTFDTSEASGMEVSLGVEGIFPQDLGGCFHGLEDERDRHVQGCWIRFLEQDLRHCGPAPRDPYLCDSSVTNERSNILVHWRSTLTCNWSAFEF
jgi:hypothetical protein